MYAPTPLVFPPRADVDRIHVFVERTGSPRAFAAAGQVLAGAVLASRGAGPLPAWVLALADAMGRSLMLVQARTVEETDAEFRVRLATAAAVLSLVRPDLQFACDGAIRVWTGLGLADVSYMTDPAALVARSLLALLVDDQIQAERSVEQLGDACGGLGLVLQDWTVVRRQRHGAGRELDCFNHLRLVMDTVADQARPALLLLAAMVAWSKVDAPRRRLLAWLDEVAQERRVAA